MNIPVEIARAQGHHGVKGAVHGVKGAVHGVKGGRPRLTLTDEERKERRLGQYAAYRRRKGIPVRSSRGVGTCENFESRAGLEQIWGKRPLTAEEYAEREPFYNAEVAQRIAREEREKELRARCTRWNTGDFDEDEDDLPEVPAPQSREERKPVGRNDPCPCGSGRKFKKCCGT